MPTSGQLKSLQETLRDLAAADPFIVNAFGGQAVFDRTVEKIGRLDAKFGETGGIYFHLGNTPQETAEAFTRIHVEQYRDGARPSLPALVAHHLAEWGLSRDSPHYK